MLYHQPFPLAKRFSRAKNAATGFVTTVAQVSKLIVNDGSPASGDTVRIRPRIQKITGTCSLAYKKVIDIFCH